MIYRLKSDPAVTVDALKLEHPTGFSGVGPFRVGPTAAGAGDFVIVGVDGQDFVERTAFEATYEPLIIPSAAAAAAEEAPLQKARKAKGDPTP